MINEVLVYGAVGCMVMSMLGLVITSCIGGWRGNKGDPLTIGALVTVFLVSGAVAILGQAVYGNYQTNLAALAVALLGGGAVGTGGTILTKRFTGLGVEADTAPQPDAV